MTKDEHVKILAYLESLWKGVAVWKLGAVDGLNDVIAIMRKEPEPTVWASFNHGTWTFSFNKETMSAIDQRYAIPIHAPGQEEYFKNAMDSQRPPQISDAEIEKVYEAALGQSLRPQDKYTVLKFGRALLQKASGAAIGGATP